MALVYIRPDADTTDGNWTNQSASATDLYDSVNESVASDSDYIRSANNPAADIVKLRLSNFGTTVIEPMTVRYRFKKVVSAGETLSLIVRLVQGNSPGTVIAEWEHSDVGDTYVTEEQELTAPEFALISDFDDLYLEFEANTSGGALFLLNGETDGFAIDASRYDTFQDYAYPTFVGGPAGGTVAVINTSDTGDNLSDVPLDLSNLTQTGTSPKLVRWDSTPYARWTPHNYCLQSQTAGTTWTATGSSVTSNTTTAPDGTSTADTVTENSANSRHMVEQNPTVGITDGTLCFSAYVKRKDRQWASIGFSDGDGNPSKNIIVDLDTGTITQTSGGLNPWSSGVTDAGSGWWRAWVSGQFNSANCYVQVGLSNSATPTISQDGALYTGDGSSGIYVWGMQVNRGYTPTNYLVTTSASRMGIPQGYDTNNSKFGVLVEAGVTNLALYSNDFTNAAWTKSNMSTALTATGPEDVSNTATILTATSANATALQAITSASAIRITSMWVKRRTGSGNIDLTQDNGSTWQTMTVTSGWTRVNMTAVSSTNPTVGIRIVTSGDAIDVWGFQHETSHVGNVGDLYAPTSTIQTLGTATPRAIDFVSCSTSTIPVGTTENSLWFHGLSIAGGNDTIIGYDGTGFTDRIQMYVTNHAGGTRPSYYIATNATQEANNYAAPAGIPYPTAYKTAMRAKTNDINGATNGDLAPTPDTTAAVESSFETFKLGGPSSTPCMFVYQARSVPRIYSDAELQAKTL